jgi:hypothetical protein
VELLKGTAIAVFWFAPVPEKAPRRVTIMLVLRRASISRPGGSWSDFDFDVLDGDRFVGRVYFDDSRAGRVSWFWGVSFQLVVSRSSPPNASSWIR